MPYTKRSLCRSSDSLTSSDSIESLNSMDIDVQSEELLDPICIININCKVPVIISNLIKSNTRVIFIDESDTINNYIYLDIDMDVIKRIYVPDKLMRYGFIVYYVGGDKITIVPLTQDLVDKIFNITLISKILETEKPRIKIKRTKSRLSICTY